MVQDQMATNHLGTGSTLTAHLDLQDVLTNHGAARCNGGLNLVAQLLGKPGKMGLTGDKVQEQWDAGHKMAISDYCRCDVLDTYFVFLRTQVLTGRIYAATGNRVGRCRKTVD